MRKERRRGGNFNWQKPWTINRTRTPVFKPSSLSGRSVLSSPHEPRNQERSETNSAIMLVYQDLLTCNHYHSPRSTASIFIFLQFFRLIIDSLISLDLFELRTLLLLSCIELLLVFGSGTFFYICCTNMLIWLFVLVNSC